MQAGFSRRDAGRPASRPANQIRADNLKTAKALGLTIKGALGRGEHAL
jgi:hypothetical protein